MSDTVKLPPAGRTYDTRASTRRRSQRLQTSGSDDRYDLTPTTRRDQSPSEWPLQEKVEFRIPLNTTDKTQTTTYVDHFYIESDHPHDMFDSMRAAMHLPKTYEHLGWRLSTARRTDPPHRLLTSQDINSAFKAARIEQLSGRQKKNVAIEILNTMPVVKEKPIKQQGDPTIVVPSQSRAAIVPQPLKRTIALCLESDDETDHGEEVPQDIDEVLTSIHIRYPAMNFPQYTNALKQRGILYLSTAAVHFDGSFYAEKVGMSDGAAHTFHAYVFKAHMKEKLAKARRKAKKLRQADNTTENKEQVQTDPE